MDPYSYVGGNPETETDPSGNLRYDPATGQAAIPQPNGSFTITGYNTGENGTFDSSVSSTGVVFNPQSFWPTPVFSNPLPQLPHFTPQSAHSSSVQRPNSAVHDPVQSACESSGFFGCRYGVHYSASLGPFSLSIPGEWSPGENADTGGGDEYVNNGDEDGPCSFTSQTPVATQKGKQSIGTVQVGEQVWAYNPKTKQMELQPILHVWIHPDTDLVDLTITSQTRTGQSKAMKPTSEVVHTNKKHPFLTVEKGFLPVGQIKLGMHVVEADGHLGVISGWKMVPGVEVMYNLEVAQDHTFTVGVGMWVVHNCGGTGPLNVSEEEIQMIREHLSTWPLTEDDGSIAPENQAMIARLQEALANGTKITGADADFYLHELYERALMKDAPYTEAAYDAAHAASINRYGVSPYALYHPDVIQQFPERFNLNWFKYWRRKR